MLLKLMLSLKLLRMLQLILLHRRHLGSRERAQAIGRMDSVGFGMTFGIYLGDNHVRFRAALWGRVRRLESAVAQIAMRLECVATGGNGLSTVTDIMGHLCRCAGRSVDNRIQFHFDTLLATRRDCRCGRRRPAALDLLTPPRSVLVVWMLLQVDHAQPLGFFHVRPSILWRQTLPLFTFKKKEMS